MGFNLGDIVKTVAPAVVGTMLGGPAGILAGIPGLGAVASSPALSSALISGLGGLAFGQKPKEALRSALLGGLGGATFGGQAAGQTAGQTTAQQLAGETAREAALRRAAENIPKQQIEAIPANTFSAKLLREIPSLGGTAEDPSLLFKLLNTNVGEGLAAGLLAQLLAGDEEVEDARGSFERRPYGYGGPGGQLGGINYMAGGGEPNYFPRRNGGIDPSEGSGRKDDVPAMLMAGEFVMTRDAVKGAGDGNLRKGIDRMYNMMDNFERMA